MSQRALTVPFQRGRSMAVIFRSTVWFAVLFTRLATIRGGRVPRVKAAKPAPPMLPPPYWMSGNSPTTSDAEEMTVRALLVPAVMRAEEAVIGAKVVLPAISKFTLLPPVAEPRTSVLTATLAAVVLKATKVPASLTLSVVEPGRTLGAERSVPAFTAVVPP